MFSNSIWWLQGQKDMEVDGDTPAKRVATGEVLRFRTGSLRVFEEKSDVSKEIWISKGKHGAVLKMRI